MFIVMEKKRMKIETVKQSSNVLMYDLFLKEDEGERMLNIVIGVHEAKRIMILLDEVETPRPLTHDLIFNILDEYDISVEEVVISSFYEGIYAATIICVCNNEKKIFDARASDAINIALKFKSPIFADEEVLKTVGFVSTELEVGDQEYKNVKIIIESADITEIEGLEKLLEIAVEQEDYDAAAELRDEIEKIKKNRNKE